MDVNECLTGTGQHRVCQSENTVMCVNRYGFFTCMCKGGFSGNRCQYDQDDRETQQSTEDKSSVSLKQSHFHSITLFPSDKQASSMSCGVTSKFLCEGPLVTAAGRQKPRTNRSKDDENVSLVDINVKVELLFLRRLISYVVRNRNSIISKS